MDCRFCWVGLHICFSWRIGWIGDLAGLDIGQGFVVACVGDVFGFGDLVGLGLHS